MARKSIVKCDYCKKEGTTLVISEIKNRKILFSMESGDSPFFNETLDLCYDCGWRFAEKLKELWLSCGGEEWGKVTEWDKKF